jgi:hypothetical protein
LDTFCTHARNWEEKFRQLAHLFDEAVDTLQFQVNTGSSDEEDCSDNNSSGSDLCGIEPLDGPLCSIIILNIFILDNTIFTLFLLCYY